VPVNHRPRRSGKSKYGISDRLGVGIVDILGVMWLQRRTTRPRLLNDMVRHDDATAPLRVVSTLR